MISELYGMITLSLNKHQIVLHIMEIIKQMYLDVNIQNIVYDAQIVPENY